MVFPARTVFVMRFAAIKLVFLMVWGCLANEHAQGEPPMLTRGENPSQPVSAATQEQQPPEWVKKQTELAIRKALTVDKEFEAAIDRYVDAVQPALELQDVVGLHFVWEVAPKRAQRLLQSLAGEQKTSGFLGTWHTWLSLAQRGEASLGARKGGTVVRIRMVDMDIQIVSPEPTDNERGWCAVSGDGFRLSDIGAIVGILESRYVADHRAEAVGEKIPMRQHTKKAASGNTDDVLRFLYSRFRLTQTPRRGSHNAAKATAHVWMVYEVANAKGTAESEAVKRVEVRDFQLVYRAGVWRLMENRRVTEEGGTQNGDSH